jgi:serine/threonine protein kinase/Tol biopolymer transport system component
MTPEQWQRAREVLADALELKLEDRPAFLDNACSSDQVLRREVVRLLSSSDEARTSFLEPSTLHVRLMPRTKVGEYEIVRLLGAGGMGEVYRAHDEHLGRDVAIKVLPAFLSRDPDRLRRFEQEARAAAALDHPNILAVHQMGTYEGAPYLVSELLEGGTLRDLLLHSPIPLSKVIDYGVQIARGLAAAHEKGIAHRDLKPENLFVTRDGRVKILDFGLAKLTQQPTISDRSAPTVNAKTEPGVVMGTVGYMSPEQVRGQRTDHRADIFAFGAILYEMLAGRRAFCKPTSAETMSAILNETPTGISQVAPATPPALQRVVQRCFEKNPECRFQSASDLAFALEALSDTSLLLATDNHPVKTSQRNHLLRATTLVLSIIVASVATWWFASPVSLQLESALQLTNDGKPKLVPSLIATDGSRIYFQELDSGTVGISQVSVAGGETSPIATPLLNPRILDVAPDSSALLLKDGTQSDNFVSLLPLPVGQPRQLVRIDGGSFIPNAAFFPDGKRIVYITNDASVYSAQKDGSNARKICELPGYAGWPTVSPDGRRIRYTVWANNSWSLFESDADGNGLHAVLTKEPQPVTGKWTSNGEYFVFQREQEGRWDLWVIREYPQLLAHSSRQPIRLSNGPLSYTAPLPSRDGKHLFVIGSQLRGELIRYDSSSKQFFAALGGMSVTDLMFSSDSKWIVYLSYPDHALWRSRADGSNRLQLTYRPLFVGSPRISPNGDKVVFTGWEPEKPIGVYIVDMRGGEPRHIVDGLSASWSPDGNSLIVQASVLGELGLTKLETLDLKTRKTLEVPDSETRGGMPFWPAQQMIIAGGEQDNLYSFDLRTQKWSELAKGPIYNWMVSPDFRYLYYVKEIPDNPEALRIRLSDRKVQAVASLKGVRRVLDQPTWGQSWLGIASDGSVLLTRDIGTQEIYALDVRWP